MSAAGHAGGRNSLRRGPPERTAVSYGDDGGVEWLKPRQRLAGLPRVPVEARQSRSRGPAEEIECGKGVAGEQHTSALEQQRTVAGGVPGPVNNSQAARTGENSPS